jgi:hypothetical protein
MGHHHEQIFLLWEIAYGARIHRSDRKSKNPRASSRSSCLWTHGMRNQIASQVVMFFVVRCYFDLRWYLAVNAAQDLMLAANDDCLCGVSQDPPGKP